MDWKNINWTYVISIVKPIFMDLVSIAGTVFGVLGFCISKETLKKTADVETILRKELEKQKMALKFSSEYSTLHSELETYITQLGEYDLSKNVISLIDKLIKQILQFSKSEDWNDKSEIEKIADWFSNEYNNFTSMVSNSDNKIDAQDDRLKINMLTQQLNTLISIIEKEGTLHDVGQHRGRTGKNKQKN